MNRELNRPIGYATMVIRCTDPPELTGKETKLELIALKNLARKIIIMRKEQYDDHSTGPWSRFMMNCTMRIRSINFMIREG